ncbi:DUF5818 domain-containing protein [Qipengyuania sp.]|uniref:DUF5818 domain-containing protein n=1 Tax=Qipengyuania sp. TaxID=2004515 RepID=UPI0035C7EBF7
MTRNIPTLALSFILALGACSAGPQEPSVSEPPPAAKNPAAGTRPSGQPQLVTYEGRLEAGTECSVLHTPDGRRFAVSLGEAEFAPGDYVAITGEMADASFCMEGEGTLIPRRINEKEPPARDRDPARAGGLALTSDYVRGRWVAKGANADCERPDFAVTHNRSGGSIIETRINGIPATGYVDVGHTPALRWDEGIPTLPIETRGPDGLAVKPARGAKTVTLAGHRIQGDGVVFVKCA